MTQPLLKAFFIGGHGRSGTTMFGGMVGAHDDVVCLPESQFIWELMPDEDEFDAARAEELLEQIRRHFRFMTYREQGCDGQVDLGEGPYTWAHLISAVARQYAEKTGKPDVQYFVDHSPKNVKNYHYLEEKFPDAKFLNVIRDGRAVAASMMSLHFGPYDTITLARSWVDYVGIALAAQYAYGAARCHTVRYEDLLLDTRITMEGVAAFLGLTFQEEMLSSAGYKVPGITKDIHQLVGKAPDPSRMNAWKKKLTPKQIRLIEYYAGHLLHYLGHELENPGRRRGPKVLERIGFELYALVRKRFMKLESKRIKKKYTKDVTRSAKA